MCVDPLSAALTIGSGIMQYQGKRQQAASYEAQAQADERNAQVAQLQREQQNKQNLDEVEKAKARRDLIAGQNRAAFGASGLDVSSGTGLDLLAANYDAYNKDRDTLNYNLQNDDYAKRVEYANYMDSASSYRAAAKSARNPLGTILSTGISLTGLSRAGASKPVSKTLNKSYRNVTPSLNKSYRYYRSPGL